MDKMVTVVTATTGLSHLRRAVESIQVQTYENIQHLIFVDGKNHFTKVEAVLNVIDVSRRKIDLVILPYPTGNEGFNGHRIYGSSLFIAKGDYVCFLDEDNWYDENHVQLLIDVVHENSWAYSLRKIVDTDGSFVCNDDCESLGNHPSILSDKDYFVDVNCFFISKNLAIQASSIWYRKAREPGVMEVDRLLTAVLRNHSEGASSGHYSVNYRAGNTSKSVKKEFFLRGNAMMEKKYIGRFPWSIGD